MFSVNPPRQSSASLADFTGPTLIIPRLQGLNKMAVLGELAQVIKTDTRMPASSSFYQAVLNRELLASTEMERGVAFPHARLPKLKEPFFALGRCDPLLSWSEGSPSRVRFVFLVAAPENDSGEYLRVISGLVRLTRELRLMKQLDAAQDASRILEVLQQVSVAGGVIRSKPAQKRNVTGEMVTETSSDGYPASKASA